MLVTCSSHTHHMLITCSSHAHHTLITRSSHVHHMLVTCSSHTHHMLVTCSSHAHHTLITCSSHARHTFITWRSHVSCTHLSYSWTVSPLLVSHCNRTTDKPHTCLPPLANITIKHTIPTHCIYLLVIAPSEKELLLVLRRLSKEAVIQAVATLHVSTHQKAYTGVRHRRSQIGRHTQE